MVAAVFLKQSLSGVRASQFRQIRLQIASCASTQIAWQIGTRSGRRLGECCIQPESVAYCFCFRGRLDASSIRRRPSFRGLFKGVDTRCGHSLKQSCRSRFFVEDAAVSPSRGSIDKQLDSVTSSGNPSEGRMFPRVKATKKPHDVWFQKGLQNNRDNCSTLEGNRDSSGGIE